MAEPNTVASWLDMLATRTATSGSDPYTHTYEASSTTDPNPYTIDLQWGHDVIRFIGVQASKIGFGWDEEKMILDLELSALKSFYTREVASATSTVITLKADGQYDAPTDGLVIGDIIHIYDVSAAAYIDAEVDGLTDTTITVSENVSAAASGDVLSLRPQTVSLSLLTPFLYQKTRYTFDATASAALAASATASNQTRLEPGTSMEFMHDFDNNDGSKRSGGSDPASLARKQYDATFALKVFLDNAQRHRDWAELKKEALVMRAFSGSSNEHELRVTFNHLKAVANETPTDADSVVYHEVEYSPQNDDTDGQAFDIKAINARSTI